MRKKPLLLLLISCWYLPLRAQQHDPSFHDAIFSGANNDPAWLQAVARQADCRYLVTGNFTSADGHPTQGVARLLPDGRPDTTFSCALTTRAAFGNTLVAVQPNGRVLISSYAASPLQRLLTSGVLDATFSLDTAAVVRTATQYGLSALIVQPDGRIVVAGWNTLVRLTSNGSLDASFQPVVLAPTTGVRSVCLEPNGRIAYAAYDGQFNQASTGRLLPSGAPDPSFTPLLRNQADAGCLLRLADGRYLLAGNFRNSSGWTQSILKLSASGLVDSSFTSYTMGAVPSGNFAQGAVRKLAEQSDGRILAAGGGASLFGSAMGAWVSLVRCTPNDGMPDPSFNENYIYRADSIWGMPNTRYNGSNIGDLLVEPDGKILVAGRFARVGGQPSGGLTRLLAAQVLATKPAAAPAAQMWPNPAHDQLHVQFQSARPPRLLTLFDAQGRLVRTFAPAGRPALTLGTAGLAAGLYLLRLEYDGQALTQRVVLE